MITSIFEAVSITNKNENISLKLVHPTAILQKNIITDSVKLSQVLINILNNAIKFTKEGFIVLDYQKFQLII